jgi:poly-gamma-glutamate synthesis protein (capsule biosynthesis protein)
VLVVAACSGPEAIPAKPVVVAAPAIAKPACGEWRYAVVAGSFELAETIARADLAKRWSAGAIAASPETEAAMAPLLGARTPVALVEHPAFDADHWGIVPVQELQPAWSVIPVDGMHPLEGETTPLAARRCGVPPNFDRSKLTTLVMSGTTALTGATSERIDQYGIEDTIKYIKPFFTSADLAHVSNEVAFVKGCKPWTGQAATELRFCSRDSYIDLFAALHVSIIELTGSHLLDYGHASLERTLDMYEKRGWVWFGGGRTQIEATAPRLIEDHGNRLAFLGCNHVNWWINRIFVGSGGANCDYLRMVWQIQDLKKRGYTVIATVQHREILTHKPDWDIVADLRKLGAAGAVFVEGSQAHTAHPWDVHHGAFVHYGPGNILFAQHLENQRDAAVDKLYIYEGRLLTVGILLVRSEHGQARTMTADERAHFMAQMTAAEAGIEAPDPWAPVMLAPETRERRDSLVARGKSQKIAITLPVGFAEGTAYPLVVDLDSGDVVDDGAFVVRRKADVTGKWLVATGDEIAEFMATKYSVDRAHIRITDDPAMSGHAKTPVLVAEKKPEPVVAVAKPVVPGLRWVRHRHHHELDYQIDADGNRVGAGASVR